MTSRNPCIEFYHSRYFFAVCILLSYISISPIAAEAGGKGPIGLWPVSNRFVLVADSSLPGLVLVDIVNGVATERLLMREANPKCVSSCPNCSFALITGSGGDCWRLNFREKLSILIRDRGALGLNSAVLEPLGLNDGGMPISDGRICLVASDGQSAYIASLRDHAVYRLGLSGTPSVQRLFSAENAEPYGLNWDANGDLLVTMHKEEVWRVKDSGEVLARYNIIGATCPGTKDFRFNLRAAIDDPTSSDHLFILASTPKTGDAVIWRLNIGKASPGNCSVFTGRMGRGPGWIDGAGEEVQFSRPHYFLLRPESIPPQLIISDIDNRALRLLTLPIGETSTVNYDRDRRVIMIPRELKRSAVSCRELNWEVKVPASWPGGNESCVRPPAAEAMSLSHSAAIEHCQTEGARLCEPFELRSTGVASGLESWTIVECASCWLRDAGFPCDGSIKKAGPGDAIVVNIFPKAGIQVLLWKLARPWLRVRLHIAVRLTPTGKLRLHVAQINLTDQTR